ncbi:MAG: hypothetical protein QOE05_3273 [Actinomycetota bacterium]|jgi:hypothetical protein|nr:hypothetical protein [Actinomycetota bacterium]
MSPEQHLDLDALTDLLAGEASLGAEEHAAGCAECRAALDELRTAHSRVIDELAALTAMPIPSDVADRLQDALRDVAAAPVDEDPATAATTVTPFPTASARDASSAGPARWLAAAAAAVVLLAGGAYGFSQLGGDSGSGAADSASGGTEASKLAVARNSSGTDYSDRASLAAAVPGLLKGGASQDTAMVAAAPPQGAAGQKSAAPQRSANLAAPAPDPLAPLRDDKGLAECLLALLPPDDPSVQPLAIDYASFRGKPAMVVLLPGAAEGKLDVFVVGPGCSRANDSVLFYTSVDAP